MSPTMVLDSIQPIKANLKDTKRSVACLGGAIIGLENGDIMSFWANRLGHKTSSSVNKAICCQPNLGVTLINTPLLFFFKTNNKIPYLP